MLCAIPGVVRNRLLVCYASTPKRSDNNLYTDRIANEPMKNIASRTTEYPMFSNVLYCFFIIVVFVCTQKPHVCFSVGRWVVGCFLVAVMSNICGQQRRVLVIQKNFAVEFAFAASKAFVVDVPNPPSGIHIATLTDCVGLALDCHLVVSAFNFDCSFHFGICFGRWFVPTLQTYNKKLN